MTERRPPKTWTEADRQDRNITIERCAQVAEQCSTEWATAQDRALIAAAIRKLKDET